MISTLFVLGIQAGLAQTQQQKSALANIPSIRDIKLPLTSAEMLVQSPTSVVVQVTGVKANPTDKGVEVILQTSKGEQLQLVNRSAGNSFIVDVPNAQLQLPSGDTFTFRSEKPIAGITQITVTNFDANTIRVIVQGEASVPVVELYDSPDEGIILSVASAAPSMQPQQQPQTPQAGQSESQTQPSLPSTSGDEPIELVVTGEQDGYRVPDASTATRTDTLIRDIPASIQIIPRQLIEDRAVTNLTDVLQNTSGVNAVNFTGNNTNTYLRGFSGRNTFFRNGSPVLNFFDNFNLDNLERIEVLKGPASVLFGQGNPGGIINLVTKKPLSEPYYNLSFQAGSFNYYHPSFDISGPLNPEKTLLYRFISSYDRADSFVEFANSERYFFTPTIEWKISRNTNLVVDFEFTDSSTTSIDSIPVIGRNIAPIPISRALVESGGFGDPFNKYDNRRYTFSTTLEHRFSQNWSLRNTFFYRSNSVRRALPNDDTFDETTGELTRIILTTDDSFHNLANNLDIVGNFKTGSIDHKLLLGFEFGRETRNRRIFRGAEGSYPSINIFNPIYSTERFLFDTFPFTTFNRDETNTNYGVYLQDQIAFTDNLKLVLGGRYDNYQQETSNQLTPVNTSQTSSAFSPRVGLIYQPTEFVSLYASFVQGFDPNTGVILVDNSAPSPQKATQYETGVKLDFGKFAASLAAFEITKTNVPTADPNPANLDFSVLSGEVKSRGVEFDLSGEILPGWNIIAAYAYTDVFVSKDNIIPVGNRFTNTPRHSASLWNTYQIQQGNFKDLGFGLGFYYVGDKAGDLDNSFEIPSYFRTDASIFYRRNNWKAQINFQNLFDITYYTGSSESRDAFAGAPFSVVGSISVTF
ncbi:MAG: TonB-dependent siderophore receptor [Nostoc sp.]|uniref:TonB-dependent siderophore receptor n=1 Tax=Nostoc sp. TaxID=1180 RepID=UPI002FFCC780